MSLIQIAWRNFCHRSLSSLLTTFSLALGVGLVAVVLSVYGVITEAFTRNASVGYNLVVGPKGSPLQLTLNSVYYLSQPIENLPYTEYMEFYPQAERAAMVQRYGGDEELGQRGGRYAPFIAGGYAIPVALGDYFGEFRVVGTTTAFFEKLRHGPNVDEEFTFSEGRAFLEFSPDHSYFEAVVGSRVAKQMDVGVGDQFFPTHGDPTGHGHDLGFTIVGVLDPTGTPNDRAAFVNLEGFYLMDGHAKPIERDEEENTDEGDDAVEEDGESIETDTDNGTAEGDEAAETSGEPDNTETADAESDDAESDDAESADAESADDAEGDQAAAGLNATTLVVAQAEEQADQETVDDESEGAARRDDYRLLSIPEREVTSILVRNGNLMFAPGMQNAINELPWSQAAAPVGEINKLMNLIVQPLLTALLVITLITCVVAAVGILVAIYNSMNDRRRDIAVMRALGARRDTVTAIILCESGLIAVIGGVFGWLLAHFSIWCFSGRIEDQTGVQIGFFTTSDYEVWILPLVLMLALIAGFLPAWSAYRTDVGSNLSA